jgi:hypothetical protein
MQIKKRARSAIFGKKTEPIEEKKEEKKEETVDNEQPVVKKESAIIGENMEKKEMTEVVENDSVAPVSEKTSDQVSQEKEQVNEEVVQPISQVNKEVVNEPPAGDGDYIVQTEVKRNLLHYFILIAVISFLIGLVSMAGISLLLQKTPFELPFITRKVEITPSPKPTILVEPTKVVVVNLAEYKIEVLNGTEIAGAASKLKTALTTEGFSVISAGNAEKSDYTDTIISAKKKVTSAYLDKLKESLKKTYTIAPDSKTLVPESSEADVIITIGIGTSGKINQ